MKTRAPTADRWGGWPSVSLAAYARAAGATSGAHAMLVVDSVLDGMELEGVTTVNKVSMADAFARIDAALEAAVGDSGESPTRRAK